VSSLERRARGDSRTGSTGRRRVVRTALAVVGVALAFLLGVAFSRAVDDRPKPSGVVTRVRTLTPLPQSAPGTTVTVTVTTSSP
jgi:hypothetical protein